MFLAVICHSPPAGVTLDYVTLLLARSFFYIKLGVRGIDYRYTSNPIFCFAISAI
jgi:hypothetical protein